MDAVEDYARRWVKQEDVELDSLSEWIKSIRHLLKRRMYMACRSVNNKPKSVFNDIDVTYFTLFSRSVHVLYTGMLITTWLIYISQCCFRLQVYYFSCLKKELDLDVSITNSTYQRTNFSKDEILANHRSVLSSSNIDTVGKDPDLPLLYWIPKLHKDPYKQRFIAGSSSCSTKPLSKLLTSIFDNY